MKSLTAVFSSNLGNKTGHQSNAEAPILAPLCPNTIGKDNSARNTTTIHTGFAASSFGKTQ
ncbi:hypothetical protein [Falsiruegeria litorea]|nr:hypothetical protein [Falsiruegeria litorea]